MKTPRNWKELKRHPLSAEYPDLSGLAWERFLTGIQKHGILPTANGRPRKVMLFDGEIIDSYQLYRACVHTGVVPEFEELKLPKGVTLEDWVEAANDNRRHEDVQSMAVRASKRRERVAFARVEGRSIRTIAEQENISKAQVERDLKVIPKEIVEAVTASVTVSGVPPGTPEKYNDLKTLSDGYPYPPETANGATTGRDGKKYPAQKPKAAASQRTLKQAIEEETPDVLVDENGQEVPPGLAPAFRGATEFRGILNQIDEITARARKLAQTPAGRFFSLQQFEIELKNARRIARFAMPFAVCPTCRGIPKNRRAKCPCQDSGFLHESNYKLLPAELRA